jgi:hypothetical protein
MMMIIREDEISSTCVVVSSLCRQVPCHENASDVVGRGRQDPPGTTDHQLVVELSSGVQCTWLVPVSIRFV